MARAVQRILSLFLIVVMGAATNAPILDAILFHGRNSTQDITPHYASKSCHAERCAISYPARHSGLSADVPPPLRLHAPVENATSPRPATPELAPVVPNQHRPRAPPSIV
jgi:hypothetical protein